MREGQTSDLSREQTHHAQACSKDDNFVQLAHLFEELVDTGPLDNVHVV